MIPLAGCETASPKVSSTVEVWFEFMMERHFPSSSHLRKSLVSPRQTFHIRREISTLHEQGVTVTYLLRYPDCFDADPEMQPYIQSGKARLVKGDTLQPDTLEAAWASALVAGNGNVDVVLFTVGGKPSFTNLLLVLLRGIVMTPPDLVTRSITNVIRTLPPSLRTPESQPRFVVITSYGMNREEHSALPLPMKPFYSILLPAPHRDKLGVERMLSHCMGTPWNPEDVVIDEVLAPGWESTEGLPGVGELKKVVIVRPAFFTDGKCVADEGKGEEAPYRTSTSGLLKGMYTVSRKDVAHLIVDVVIPQWESYQGKAVAIGY
ncbi:uncharacterized protein BXZ73DRAFT_83201 [Epithele typhae]|uniref:uncharacterized protein n=1 Tax=Epithele typhae TaxID=378194 RepID=UPI002008D8F6|nr:uncharacterized protein BXZ73DRAFT_83201 [Epithele typhae]KAH9910787.1 hypothetical protein BXZ73DRAFT_83201 [Epithele typhae]